MGDSPLQHRSEPPLVREAEPGSLRPLVWLALLAVVLACAAFVADRVYQRYLEYRAVEELNAYFADFQAQQKAEATRLARDRQARQRERRQARALTTQGRPYRMGGVWKRSPNTSGHSPEK